MSWPLNVTVPRAGLMNPAMLRNSVDLPAPLRPSTSTTSPGLHVERDRVEHGDAPVAGVQVADLKHRACP